MIRSNAGRNKSFWRSSRGFDIPFPQAINPCSGNHRPPKTGIPNCKKAGTKYSFLAKSIIDPLELMPVARGYLNSSRTTNYRREHLAMIEEGRIALFGDHKPTDTLVGVAALSRPE